jgi:hypothetical protein
VLVLSSSQFNPERTPDLISLLNSGYQASSQIQRAKLFPCSRARGTKQVGPLNSWNYHSRDSCGEDSDGVLWLDFRNLPSSTSDDFELGFHR